MEFDKTRLYTKIDTDVPKEGSRGFFSDELGVLRKYIEDDRKDKAQYIGTLEKVKDMGCTYRYMTNGVIFAYFYLIEEPTEKMIYEELKSSMVNHPEHYNGDTPYECIKVLKAWLSPEEFVGFLKGNAIKYLCRVGKKDSVVQDLKKSKWYIDKLIESEEETQCKV